MKKEEALEASEVTNWLLQNYSCSQFSLTNLKLNKILYFLHGVSLAREGNPLLRNRFECWQRGPVVASLYHRLKRYGKSEVNSLLTYRNYETGLVEPVPTERCETVITPTIIRAADYFVEKSASWLVTQSHTVGGPWYRHYREETADEEGTVIPDHEIREHFVNIYGGARLH